MHIKGRDAIDDFVVRVEGHTIQQIRGSCGVDGLVDALGEIVGADLSENGLYQGFYVG
jgi:predicted Zn-dependent protease with MMP-like domain